MNEQDDRQFIFSDVDLARRLEMAEGHTNREFVETKARLSPELGAEWIEVAGASVMYDGAASPMTQTFGLGLFQETTAAEMDEIENFFRTRGAPVFHEVSPLADASLLSLLNERGYQPIEFTSVMFRPISPDGADLPAPRDDKVKVRIIGEDEHELWAQTAAHGWSEFTEFADLILELSRVSTKRAGAASFLAEIDGEPIATGGIGIYEGVVLLAGASTVPEGRRQGAQTALLGSRLRYAAEQGCDIAMMCAQPGSTSQRNAERNGFRIAYTRIKWRLPQEDTAGE
ncbi:MAG TPA: GNAT family N-acetyltransferase [Pyrinomonadaceae bacterium]|jgi:GNAT superfamily N-acetyltransferase|nr:GNAT family N-acetyltransferase [Pyrinomonadaceae bacterium]